MHIQGIITQPIANKVMEHAENKFIFDGIFQSE